MAFIVIICNMILSCWEGEKRLIVRMCLISHRWRSPAVLCWGSSTLTFKSAVDGFDSKHRRPPIRSLRLTFHPSASKWRPLHPSSRRACMRYSGKIHLTRSPTAPRADRRRTQHPRGPPSLEIYRNLIPRRSRNGWRKLAESWATGGRSLLRTCHRIQPTR